MKYHNIAVISALIYSYVEGAPRSPSPRTSVSSNAKTINRRQAASVAHGVQVESLASLPYLWTASAEIGDQAQDLIIDTSSSNM